MSLNTNTFVATKAAKRGKAAKANGAKAAEDNASSYSYGYVLSHSMSYSYSQSITNGTVVYVYSN
jgi:hypothetical protein